MHPVLGLFRRNAWATRELLGFCSGLSPEVRQRADPDVYGSIEATFNHIVGAEQRYLSRLDGAAPRTNEKEPLKVTELIEPARACAERWEALLRSDLEVDRVRQHQAGEVRFKMPDWLGFVQAVHHGDDHRTQINTLLGRQGIEPHNLDGWVFGDLPQEAGRISASAEQLLPRFLSHHLWAIDQLMRWYVRLEDDHRELTAAGTYGSIRDTLKHMVFGDHQYRGWLEYPDWDACLREESNYDRRVGGEDGWSPAWAIVVQAVHHGNDHRTHVGTVALANELNCPALDVWSYAEAVGVYSDL